LSKPKLTRSCRAKEEEEEEEVFESRISKMFNQKNYTTLSSKNI
jgi:hypothetical protein